MVYYNKPQYIFNLRNEDILIIRTILSNPKVSGIYRGFHCTGPKVSGIEGVHSTGPKVSGIEGLHCTGPKVSGIEGLHCTGPKVSGIEGSTVLVPRCPE